MAKAKFDITSIEIPTIAAKPLYAGVGASDVALTAVKEYVADVQKKVADFEPAAVRKQATDAVAARRAAVEARVADLQDEAKALPTRVQNVVTENVALASASFDDLAKRGQTIVTRARKQQPTVGVQVKTTPAGTVSAQASATTTTTKPRTAPVRKAPAQKTTVKKAAARKTSTGTSTTRTTGTTKASTTGTTARKA